METPLNRDHVIAGGAGTVVTAYLVTLLTYYLKVPTEVATAEAALAVLVAGGIFGIVQKWMSPATVAPPAVPNENPHAPPGSPAANP